MWTLKRTRYLLRVELMRDDDGGFGGKAEAVVMGNLARFL